MSRETTLSVIMPTCNRYEVALQNVANILRQRASGLEVVVCDDSDKEYKSRLANDFRTKLKIMGAAYHYCARFREDGSKEYGLARARNIGVLESRGEALLFLDDRITPKGEESFEAMRSELMSRPRKTWVYGEKGSGKRVFVENFSAVRRADLIESGMFCERVDKYGGATREIIARMTAQGFSFLYVPSAQARPICPSSGWNEKPAQIRDMDSLIAKMWGTSFSDHFPRLFRNSAT